MILTLQIWNDFILRILGRSLWSRVWNVVQLWKLSRLSRLYEQFWWVQLWSILQWRVFRSRRRIARIQSTHWFYIAHNFRGIWRGIWLRVKVNQRVIWIEQDHFCWLWNIFHREPDDNQIVHHHQTRKMTRLSDPSEMEKYFLYDVGGSSRPTDEFQTDTSGNNSSSIVASGSESDTSSTCENTFYFGSNEKRLHYDELETFVATKVKNSKERCKREECGNLKFDPPVTPCPKEIIQVKSAPRSYSVSKYDGGTEATQLTSVWRRDDVQNSISRNENQTLEYYTNGVEEYLKNEGIKLPNLFDRVFQFSDKSSPNDLSENLILNASLESQIKMSEMESKPFEDLDDRRKNTCDDGKTYINHCNTWIGRKSQSTSSNIATFQVRMNFFSPQKKLTKLLTALIRNDELVINKKICLKSTTFTSVAKRCKIDSWFCSRLARCLMFLYNLPLPKPTSDLIQTMKWNFLLLILYQGAKIHFGQERRWKAMTI